MNENITKYLSQNKEKYAREALKEALLKAGYRESDVSEGFNVVYGTGSLQKNILPAKNFWDLSGKKTYDESSEKLADFLLGFGGSVLIAVLANTFLFGIIIFYLVAIGLIVYFASRRTFLTAGLAVGIFLSPTISFLLRDVLGNLPFFSYSPF